LIIKKIINVYNLILFTVTFKPLINDQYDTRRNINKIDRTLMLELYLLRLIYI